MRSETLCNKFTRNQCNEIYNEMLLAPGNNSEGLRRLCMHDLYFLLTRGLKRFDADHPWIYDRIREVEKEPDWCLDLWAREHYKSTIITFALTIQEILRDPNVTIGIFSHTRPIAKAFLEQIKRELENNTFLQQLFPEILYVNPKGESEKWGLDSGIIVKRTQNPKESTVEAWGLVDGQPTSKHFKILIYDDVVTKESVTSSDMMKKVTDAWGLSTNLGAKDGTQRYIGTRYHQNDTYSQIIKRETVKEVRLYGPTDLGTKDFLLKGNPVLLTRPALIKKRKDMGPYIYACQMLQNPQADTTMGFKVSWLQHYDFLRNHAFWNYYILVDPAGEKKKDSDYTVMVVIGLGPDKNYYLVDGIRDRLNLKERAKHLFRLHRKWNFNNRVLATGYEKYGLQADIEHIQFLQELYGYRFKMVPLGGSMPKNDRIRRLTPDFEQGRFWLPHSLYFVDYEENQQDFVKLFIDEEYEPFPVAVHDDMLDACSRIKDKELEAQFPLRQEIKVPSVTMTDNPQTVKSEYNVLD